MIDDDERGDGNEVDAGFGLFDIDEFDLFDVEDIFVIKFEIGFYFDDVMNDFYFFDFVNGVVMDKVKEKKKVFFRVLYKFYRKL